MIQIYAGRIQKEAESNWKTVQESRNIRAELEKKICATKGDIIVINLGHRPYNLNSEMSNGII